jgi:hypothetical protein
LSEICEYTGWSLSIEAGLRFKGKKRFYFRNSLELVDRVSETLLIYVDKTGPGNFLPYVNLGTMGHQNDPPLMSSEILERRDREFTIVQ